MRCASRRSHPAPVPGLDGGVVAGDGEGFGVDPVADEHLELAPELLGDVVEVLAAGRAEPDLAVAVVEPEIAAFVEPQSLRGVHGALLSVDPGIEPLRREGPPGHPAPGGLA